VRFVKSVRAAALRVGAEDSILDHDEAWRPDSPALRVTTRLLATFHKRVADDGAIPIIVIFPDYGDLGRMRADKSCAYEPLLKSLKGLRVVDLLDAFHEFGPDHKGRGHYDGTGNAIVARYLDRYIRTEGLADPVGVRKRLSGSGSTD